MKKKKKVISFNNLPPKSPIVSTGVAYLFLDKFDASGLVWGIVGTVFVLVWIVWIVDLLNFTPVDIFKEKP